MDFLGIWISYFGMKCVKLRWRFFILEPSFMLRLFLTCNLLYCGKSNPKC